MARKRKVLGPYFGAAIPAAAVELPNHLKFRGIKQEDGTYSLRFTEEEMKAIEAAEKKQLEQRPHFVTIDVSAGWDLHEQLKIIGVCLKKLGLAKLDLLFQGSGEDRIPVILETGNDLGKVSGIEALDEDIEQAYKDAMDFDQPTLVIYDRTLMEEGMFEWQDEDDTDRCAEWCAKPGTDPIDALLAVIVVISKDFR